MKKTFKIYNDTEIQYEVSEAQALETVRRIIEWCEKYDVGCGESLVQSDDPQIEAPFLLAEIIDDVLKFKSLEDDNSGI